VVQAEPLTPFVGTLLCLPVAKGGLTIAQISQQMDVVFGFDQEAIKGAPLADALQELVDSGVFKLDDKSGKYSAGDKVVKNFNELPEKFPEVGRRRSATASQRSSDCRWTRSDLAQHEDAQTLYRCTLLRAWMVVNGTMFAIACVACKTCARPIAASSRFGTRRRRDGRATGAGSRSSSGRRRPRHGRSAGSGGSGRGELQVPGR
jgi:hypothetical protein